MILAALAVQLCVVRRSQCCGHSRHCVALSAVTWRERALLEQVRDELAYVSARPERNRARPEWVLGLFVEDFELGAALLRIAQLVIELINDWL